MLAQIEHFVRSNVEWISTTAVSILGSLKAISLAKNDPVCERILDFVVGVSAGFLLGFYVAPDLGLVASLIVALVSSLAAVLILETLMGSIPSMVQEAIRIKLGIKKE